VSVDGCDLKMPSESLDGSWPAKQQEMPSANFTAAADYNDIELRPPTPAFRPTLERQVQEDENHISSLQGETGSTNGSRQAVSGPEPMSTRRWGFNQSRPRNGWRMKTRYSTVSATDPSVDIVVVYLYDSSTGDGSQNLDADLEIFHSHAAAHTNILETSTVMGVQHGSADMENQSPQTLLSVVSPKSGRRSAVKSPDKSQQQCGSSTSWIQDPNMVEAHIPNCRTVTFGFDIWSAPQGLEAASTAAEQMKDALLEIRKRHQPPLVYLGHTFGGLIALEALFSMHTMLQATTCLQPDTAGMLLFSCPMPGNHVPDVAKIYKPSASEKMFSTLCNRDTLTLLRTKLRKRMRSVMSETPSPAPDPTQAPKIAPETMSMNFPIYQILTRDEFKKSSVQSMGDFLGGSAKMVLLEKDYPHAMHFTTSNVSNFHAITMLIKTILRECNNRHFLVAAAAGRCKEVATLMNLGVDINVRDVS